jgi:threonine dehydratase
MDGTFVHPFDNHDFIAGHGTMGLEIVEDLPEVRTVIAAIGGGGLITGLGSAVKALKPDVRVIGAEPETASPYAYSLANGGPQRFPNWQASFVDGAGGKSVTERMWQRMQAVVDGTITVTLDQVRDAMRLMAEKARVVAEGAGALSVAAALSGEPLDGPIVCVVSGGNIDLDKFAELIA